MRFLAALALGATISSHVLAVPVSDTEASQAQQQFVVEVAPDHTKLVTEDEKLALKKDGVKFIDVTDEKNGSSGAITATKQVTYPLEMKHTEEVLPLTRHLSKDTMRQNLEEFSSFHNRYYKSYNGILSANWLYNQIEGIINQAAAWRLGVSVEKFAHPWGQFSIIARIPGNTDKTVVLGAHQDSLNLNDPWFGRAPGADDDGSGSVTILEAFSALMHSDAIVGNSPNTIEFHWYAAEEGGLLGSKAVFTEYRKQGRDVRAMMQQDMTGYIQGMLNAGLPPAVGVIVDFVDPELTKFIKRVIAAYCDVPYAETKCGYACSDHASASRNGYPAAFVFESEFNKSNPRIHSADDLIKYVSFDHMLQHARMSLAFAYELAFAPLT